MCHGFIPRDQPTDRADDADDEPTESEPPFLNDESATDAELITDGGAD
jgi:hypothetical protein